jgi:hypothetical protein
MGKIVFNHNLLPPVSQVLLKAAARVQGVEARDKAIDAAVATARRVSPRLFKPVPIIELQG